MLKGTKAVLLGVVSILMVMLISALVVSGCSGGGAAVAAGDTVSVKYKLTLDNGNAIDSSLPDNPLKFVVGHDPMIQGFTDAVIGMKQDEEKNVVIPPEKAYGPRDSSMVRNFSREGLPEGFVPEIGMMLNLNGPAGPMPAKIVGISEDSLSLDLNHQLAGENLNFAIKIVGIAKGQAPAADPAPAAVPAPAKVE